MAKSKRLQEIAKHYFFVVSKEGVLTKYTGDEESITIPRNVTKIGEYAFSATPFSSVVISDTVKVIGSNAFMRCKKLVSVTIPAGIKKIEERAFYDCTSLVEISFKGTVEQWNAVKKQENWYRGISADCVDCKDGTVELPHFIIDNGVLVKYLGAAQTLRIPEGITAIGDYALCRCHSFFDVVIPEGVTSIGDYAFSINLRLSYVELPRSLKKIGTRAFQNCRRLDFISYAGTEEEWKAVEKGELWNAVNGFNPADSEITMFFNLPFCSSDEIDYLLQTVEAEPKRETLRTVLMGENLEFNTTGSVLTSYSGKEPSVVIPKGIKLVGEYAFGGNDFLVEVKMPGNVRRICTAAFTMCTSLVSVDLPRCLSKIYRGAFFGCAKLPSVTLPAAVTKIGRDAFSGCTSLKEICYVGTTAQWQSVEKGENWNKYVPAKCVVCTDGTVEL